MIKIAQTLSVQTLYRSLVGLLMVAVLLLGFLTHNTAALSGSEFNPGNIISDALFYNPSAMNASSIQQFLNAKVPTCDTNGTKLYSGSLTRAQYGTSKGVPPPYICVKDYTQSVPAITNSGSDLCGGSITAGSKTAAQIIYDVAQACSVNPQVLIVLLQKEQSLVTDDWPWPIQYRSATGYGCPDTAPCDSEYYGFFNQVYQAAKAYKRYQANATDYNYRAGRNNTILWNPNAGCGSSVVWIDNQATAGLYTYTPYRPNQAALDNLYGNGDACSSYGNRNFWRFWRDWFGDTQSFTVRPELVSRYNALGGVNSYLGRPITYGGCGIPGNGCYQNFQNGHIYWTSTTGAWDISGGIGNKWLQLGAERSYLLYPTSGETHGLKNSGSYQQYQIGRIYWSATTGAWDVSGAIGDKWIALGADKSLYGYPKSSETHGLKNSGAYQQFQIGRIYWTATTGAYPVAGGIGDYWLSKGAQNSTLGYPTSGEKVDGSGQVYQEFEGGKVYWTAAKGAWGVLTNIDTKYSSLGGINSYLRAPYTLGGCGIKDGGCYQNFLYGNIYWSPSSGAWDISGGIGARWITLGAERSALAYPTSGEIRGLKSGGAYQQFQNGRIYWSAASNAREISGAILSAWSALGAENSLYGYPVASEVKGLKNSGAYQQFQIGRIYWTATTGAYPVAGGIGDYWLSKGAQNSTLGYPTSGEKVDGSGQVYQEFEGGKVYWTAAKGAWSI